MPKFSPITRDHILDAMTYVGPEPSEWPLRSRPTTYVVIDPRNGAPLPPKLVLSTAVAMASGERRRRVVSGGQHTNKKLTELGFAVIEKAFALTASPSGASVSQLR